MQLVLNGRVTLVVGGVAGIERYAGRWGNHGRGSFHSLSAMSSVFSDTKGLLSLEAWSRSKSSLAMRRPMRRREFFAVVGGAAVAWPFATRAQQPAPIKRIGLLIPFADSDKLVQNQVAAFREELRRLGWSDDRNVQIVARWNGGDAGQIPFVAKELVTLKPDVILAYTTAVTAALKRRPTRFR